ncbi:hypothetical protein [Nocardia vulneris]|uniref:hypothetical protein n=1 Tax=Nocardia vulneris TaxID=1141657 RepID=UPI00069030D6|nr:hypothetical protein [Nocardia vulneris]
MAGVAPVQVDHHQFSVGAVDADTLDTRDEGTLLCPGPGFVTVLTGIAYGPVSVTVVTTDAAPEDNDLAEWEAVEETGLESAGELRVLRLDGEVVPGFEPIPPGRYRIRTYARGRDDNWDLEVAEPSETYRLVLWPTTEADNGIRQLHKTDTAYSAPAKTLPIPDYDRSYIRDADGLVQRVPHDHPDVKAFHERVATWGGRPPTHVLTAGFGNYDAQFLSGLDRDLVDGIVALSPARQRELARWCVHRAFERAGLTEFADFRAGLAALDAGDPAAAPPDFGNGSRIVTRIDTDPEIPVTIVSGLPGNTEQIQQHKAVWAYSAATDIDDPLKAACCAVRAAATTYGMDYPELFDALRTEFHLPTP